MNKLKSFFIFYLFSFLFLIVSLCPNGFAGNNEQKILFCADSIRCGSKTRESHCKEKCQKYSCDLNALLSDGWRVTTTAAKEIMEEKWFTIDRPGVIVNSCV